MSLSFKSQMYVLAEGSAVFVFGFAESMYIWDLKDNDIKFSIKWRVIKRCKAYKSSSKRCNLRLHEKFLIICHPELGTLNSRNELISACRHRKKHLLANF